MAEETSRNNKDQSENRWEDEEGQATFRASRKETFIEPYIKLMQTMIDISKGYRPSNTRS
jgi:hypothetical protein